MHGVESKHRDVDTGCMYPKEGRMAVRRERSTVEKARDE
jgi:hypothetical protein